MANKNKNPIVDDSNALDTIQRAKCVVNFLAETVATNPPDSLSDDAGMGFYLVLDCVSDALEVAGEQVDAMKEPPKRKGVRRG